MVFKRQLQNELVGSQSSISYSNQSIHLPSPVRKQGPVLCKRCMKITVFILVISICTLIALSFILLGTKDLQDLTLLVWLHSCCILPSTRHASVLSSVVFEYLCDSNRQLVAIKLLYCLYVGFINKMDCPKCFVGFIATVENWKGCKKFKQLPVCLPLKQKEVSIILITSPACFSLFLAQ